MQPLTSAAGQLPRLLVVDDEAQLRTVISEVLIAQGYETVGIGSAEEALRILQNQDFDVLLTDLMMPGMDGIELLRAALEIDPQLVAIMMTGQGTVETAVEAMKIGAFDYVMKPFRSSTLLPTVERALEVRRLRMENGELRDTLAIHDLAEAISFTLDQRVILNKMADAALAQCDADEVTILLPIGSGGELSVAVVRGRERSHLLGERISSSQGVAGWVARSQEAVMLYGAVNDPRFAPDNPRGDILAAVSMPMLVAGKLVGILNVNSLRRRAFRLGQIKGLSILASTGAAALEHASLYREALDNQERYRFSAERLRAMNDFARTVSSTLDLDSILGIIVGEVSRAVPCAWCAVVEHLPGEGTFAVRAGWSSRPELAAPGAALGRAESASGVVRQTGNSYFAQDTGDAGVAPLVGLPLQAVSSYLCVPIIVDDTFWGTLDVGFDEPGVVSPDRIEFLEALGSHLSAAIRNADLHGRLRDAFEEIGQAKVRLEEGEALYRAVVENMAEGIAIARAGTVSYVNEAFLRIAGVDDAAQVLGTEVRRWVALEDRHALGEWFRARAGGESVLSDFTFRILRPNGEVRTVEISSATIGYAGEPAGLAVFHDVTERKQAEEDLRQSEEQLRQAQKMEAVGNLAGGIAHDFNNLLTAIIGFGQLVLADPSLGEIQRNYLLEMVAAGERAASLTRQLLAFSRRQVMRPEVMDVNHAVAEMEKLLRRLIGEDVDLHTRLDPALGWTRADPGQIEQVVLNLAVNARDAMPRGGILTIETRNTELDEGYCSDHPEVAPGPYVLVSVTDTGQGIAAEHLPHIFEPFYTTKEEGKGTGMGLATVYGVVKQSNGHLSVYSEVESGTTFNVYLPRVEAPAMVEQASTATSSVSLTGAESILLVEDEPGVRALTQAVLEGAGYTVFEAESPASALELVEKLERPVALLVSDVVMPGMTGPEVAAAVTARWPGCKVLLMSGYPGDALQHQGRIQAHTPYLEKPFRPRALLEKVREVLDVGR